MTNKERRAEWMTVAEMVHGEWSAPVPAEKIRQEANRRFPGKMVTDAQKFNAGSEIRAVASDGKRIILYRMDPSSPWMPYFSTEMNDAIVAACTAPLHEEEE